MAVVTDLISQSVDKKPSEFSDTFNELIKDRVATAIAQKKLDLSQALFGAPEIDNQDDEEQPELELDQEEETPTEDEIEDGDEEKTPAEDN